MPRAFLADDDERKQPATPVMNRSRNQLSTAYAPGSFFTFEGGLGACIALPDQADVIDEAPIDEPTKEQILLRLREVWQSWFSRAHALSTGARPISPRQCVDEMLLKDDNLDFLGASKLAFVNPSKIGYAPAPLTFVCNTCKLFRAYDSVAKLAEDFDNLSCKHCPNPKKKGKCQWRQLDVIFVHWSGEWQPAMPGMWEWSDKENKAWLAGEVCSHCGKKNFLLNTESPRIGEWSFQCVECGHQERATWLQNDQFTTEVFRETAGKRVGERRMEPISYRASSAFYAQSEQFVVFSQKDQGLLAFLAEGHEAELANFIASQYGFGGSLPTEDEMKDILLRGGHEGEWESYEKLIKWKRRLEDMGDHAAAQEMAEEQQKLIKRWQESDPPLIPVNSELPQVLHEMMACRFEFSSRYDPFVLSVEHEALKRSKLSRTAARGERAPFVRFHHLDNDLAPKNEHEKTAQEQETHRLMKMLGMSELGLIREFDLCKFTHGYTRVNATPVMEKRGQDVPVRLKLFESLRNGKRPIYVVTQSNEAIYVQLKPELVYEWLQKVGVTDLPAWNPADKIALGGALIQTAEPFGRYFSALHPGEASTYRYVYTLLHSYAHLFTKTVAELSGLDVGSLGEYLFPTDLAFVVYRNGTTMDLGNLSSLWRNENYRFLALLLEPASHRCNSGSLCDFSGGACPDCIMVPETTCIAQNQLLSRAVLRGGLAPREDLTHKTQRIPGFFEVTNGGSAL